MDKICSNMPNHPVNRDVLKHISNLKAVPEVTFDSDSSFVKVLGLAWNSHEDFFNYQVNQIKRECTKRTMLSELARIYDPIGLLTPLTFSAKHLIQRLWLLGTSWDEKVPDDINQLWTKYTEQLPNLSQLRIPRRITRNGAWPIEPKQRKTFQNDPEVSIEKRACVLTNTLPVEEHPFDRLINKYSSLRKIQRVVAYCKRFIQCLRKNKRSDHFTEFELHEALMILVRHVQQSSFKEEIHRLSSGQALPKSIKSLNPYLDDQGVFRVGGRLARSDLSFEAKHPALLPRKHRLTQLIIQCVHNENLHPGLQTLHYLLLQNFWILSPRRVIRDVEINQPVIIKDECTHPLRWHFGKIIQLYYGRDGVPRSATIKTSQGQLNRPLVKLCPIPPGI
ncbi:pao retrotransposon peptidase domain-containing protein [Phthorimaea operculella]|nr:pao retrotransposon peptidase domain-containing protein [Phthorimaea operculella]